jgi:hypothetical protein
MSHSTWQKSVVLNKIHYHSGVSGQAGPGTAFLVCVTVVSWLAQDGLVEVLWLAGYDLEWGVVASPSASASTAVYPKRKFPDQQSQIVGTRNLRMPGMDTGKPVMLASITAINRGNP